MAQTTINNGDSGLVARTAINDNFTELYAENSVNIVLVKVKSDLPTTLVDGTRYIFDAALTFTNGDEVTIPTGAAVAFGQTSPASSATYTGTGTFISGASVGSLTFDGVNITDSGTGTLLSLTGGAGFPSVSFGKSSFVGFASLGTMTGIYASLINCTFILIDTGLSFVNCPVVAIKDCLSILWNNTTTDFFAMSGASTGQIVFNGNLVTPQSNEAVLNIDSALTAEVSASGNVFSDLSGGALFRAGSLDQQNIYSVFAPSHGVQRSQAKIKMAFIGNVTATTIASSGVPVQVNATWVTTQEQRLTGTSAGRMTVNNIEDVTLNIILATSVEIATGSKIAMHYWFRFGNAVENLITGVTDAGGGLVEITTSNAHGLTTGDHVVNALTTSYNGWYEVTVTGATTFTITETFVATETGEWSMMEQSKGFDLTSGTTSSVTIADMIAASTNDYMELWISNDDTTANPTIHAITATAKD